MDGNIAAFLQTMTGRRHFRRATVAVGVSACVPPTARCADGPAFHLREGGGHPAGFNAEQNPRSANAHDSRAEAYEKAGNPATALASAVARAKVLAPAAAR